MILCYHTNLDKLPAVFIPIFLTIPLLLPLHLQVVYSSSLASWFQVQNIIIEFFDAENDSTLYSLQAQVISSVLMVEFDPLLVFPLLVNAWCISSKLRNSVDKWLHFKCHISNTVGVKESVGQWVHCNGGDFKRIYTWLTLSSSLITCFAQEFSMSEVIYWVFYDPSVHFSDHMWPK